MHDDHSESPELEDLAGISRPGKDWCLVRNGKKGGAKQSKSTRTNWYHPLLWIPIDTAARRNNWSATYIVKQLHRDNPTLFTKLSKGTVQKWIDSLIKRGWSETTKANVAQRHALAGSNQAGILAKHPDIVQEIKSRLQGLRTSGLAVNVLLVQTMMLAIIQHHTPDLLIGFKCSEVSRDCHNLYICSC